MVSCPSLLRPELSRNSSKATLWQWHSSGFSHISQWTSGAWRETKNPMALPLSAHHHSRLHVLEGIQGFNQSGNYIKRKWNMLRQKRKKTTFWSTFSDSQAHSRILNNYVRQKRCLSIRFPWKIRWKRRVKYLDQLERKVLGAGDGAGAGGYTDTQGPGFVLQLKGKNQAGVVSTSGVECPLSCSTAFLKKAPWIIGEQ